eukprot:TRINITY_DN22389_c0_g1_i1.p1 TRINITY_DN22389_c0_g1~~TRINITY_DN22389_c0_g1_i1.p1  ORF type:complete len:223 (-),score=37.73 TRINITY_DN22389_c0_g1_i1:38-661(-)
MPSEATGPAKEKFEQSDDYKPCQHFQSHCMSEGYEAGMSSMSETCQGYNNRCGCNAVAMLARMKDPNYADATASCCATFEYVWVQMVAKVVHLACVNVQEELSRNVTRSNALCKAKGVFGEEADVTSSVVMLDLLTADSGALRQLAESIIEKHDVDYMLSIWSGSMSIVITFILCAVCIARRLASVPDQTVDSQVELVTFQTRDVAE